MCFWVCFLYFKIDHWTDVFLVAMGFFTASRRNRQTANRERHFLSSKNQIAILTIKNFLFPLTFRRVHVSRRKTAVVPPQPTSGRMILHILVPPTTVKPRKRGEALKTHSVATQRQLLRALGRQGGPCTRRVRHRQRPSAVRLAHP
jgi:hypothetical protein